MNFTLNPHGVVAIVLVTALLVFAVIQAEIASFVYAAIAVITYAGFVFFNIRESESLSSDKRRIVSEKERFDIARRLIGWHIFAVLAVVGLLIPFDGFISLVWLVVAGIAGLGIPYVVLQQKQSE